MSSKTMAQKLKSLKRGQSFVVITPHDRNAVLHAANVLFAAGAINYEITTKKISGGKGFNVIRLPNMEEGV